jgi:hypothetical protein
MSFSDLYSCTYLRMVINSKFYTKIYRSDPIRIELYFSFRTNIN